MKCAYWRSLGRTWCNFFKWVISISYASYKVVHSLSSMKVGMCPRCVFSVILLVKCDLSFFSLSQTCFPFLFKYSIFSTLLLSSSMIKCLLKDDYLLFSYSILIIFHSYIVPRYVPFNNMPSISISALEMGVTTLGVQLVNPWWSERLSQLRIPLLKRLLIVLPTKKL